MQNLNLILNKNKINEIEYFVNDYKTVFYETSKKSLKPLRGLILIGSAGFMHEINAEKIYLLIKGIDNIIPTKWVIKCNKIENIIDYIMNINLSNNFDFVIYYGFLLNLNNLKYNKFFQIMKENHANGLPLINIHSYGTSFWNEINGAKWLGHHGSYWALNIIKNVDHPIVKNLPDKWEIRDELFISKILNDNINILANAKIIENNKYKNSIQPCIWTNIYGKARVLVITLGHNNNIFSEKEFIKLMANGIKWILRL